MINYNLNCNCSLIFSAESKCDVIEKFQGTIELN